MNNNNTKSPFCKVCFDSGNPDTKHWVKDRNGKVCCPTLLSLKCRLCGQCGHTVKYCSKAKPVEKPNIEKHIAKSMKPAVNISINKFELLFNDESDDEDQKQEQEQQKPEQQKQPPKRWIDYDTDSDDETPSSKSLAIPVLKRYGGSCNSDDSLVDIVV